MRCEKCGNIIDNNALQCPYCRNTVNGDYFGYDRAMRMQQAQSNVVQKTDNSVKIVIIVLGVIMGLFSIVVTAVFGFSGNSGSVAARSEYDGCFDIAPEMLFAVTDDTDAASYWIYMEELTPVAKNEEKINFCLAPGDGAYIDLPDGDYKVTVKKSYSDKIVLKMTVSSGCIYNTVEVQYDKRQLQTTNGVNASFNIVDPDNHSFVNLF